LFIEPSHTLAILPKSILDALFGTINVGAEAMLFTFVPPALVFAAICPMVQSEAFFLVLVVLAVITHTIRIDVNAVALHIV